MEIILDDIDEIDGFNARATIRKLKINIGGDPANSMASENNVSREPYVDLYEDIDDVYVDTYSDYVYFMTPCHIISYLYGSNTRYVTFEI